LYSTGSAGATSLAAGLATGFDAARLTARFTGRVRRPAVRVGRVARMFSPPRPVLPSQARNCVRCSFYLGRSRSGSRPVLHYFCSAPLRPDNTKRRTYN
jgi:hypothetical protein